MTEYDRAARAPILVVELSSVFGGDRAHGLASFRSSAQVGRAALVLVERAAGEHAAATSPALPSRRLRREVLVFSARLLRFVRFMHL